MSALQYSQPIATTRWTAGNAAIVSWVNDCRSLAATSFPIMLLHQSGNLQVPVAGIGPIGNLDCSIPGSTQVQIPATVLQGTDYSILVSNGGALSYSALFTILNSTVPTTTTTTTAAATAAVTGSLTSTPPSPTTTGVATSNTKGSSAGAIAGSVAGAVVVVVAVLGFVCFRRKRASARRSNDGKEEHSANDYNQTPQKMNRDHIPFSNSDTPATTVAHVHGPQPSSPVPQSRFSDQGPKVWSLSYQSGAETPLYSRNPQWRQSDQEATLSTAIDSPPTPSPLAPHTTPSLLDNSGLYPGQGISDELRRNLAQRELALLQAQYDLQLERLRAEQEQKVRSIQDRLG